ncbi:MAG: SWIM zinc finger family protein [Haloglomus sp.]
MIDTTSDRERGTDARGAHSREDAERPQPLAPDTSRLDGRSARAWTEPMAVTALGGGRYEVENQAGRTYVVNLPESDCTCPDHRIRGESCKHLRRVAIEVTRGRVPAPGKVRGTCRGCGHEAFVPEDGPAYCRGCRLEPGDLATDRETGDAVLVVAVTDERADETEVAGTGRSVADYETNEGYPRDDPVVEVVYPFGNREVALEDRRRYSFPHSRLLPRGAALVDADVGDA